MVTKNRKLEPNEWYSLMDLVALKAIPWAQSYWSIKKLIDKKENQKALKVLIQGTGKNTKYHFKGENIINFISKVESGKLQIQ